MSDSFEPDSILYIITHSPLHISAGAGKTYFLSCLVSTFIQLHSASDAADKPFNILVTSATNSAINTCLEAIATRLLSIGSTVNVARITRTGEVEKEWMTNLQIHGWDRGTLDGNFFATQDTCVVGSTPWRLPSCAFAQEEEPAFHLVLIDEGSQMTVAQSSLVMQHLHPEGRLIVAGDHLQLPPIIKGVYPEHKQGDLKYYGSILECLIRDRSKVKVLNPFDAVAILKSSDVDVSQAFCCKLRENFRMNDRLAAFTQLTYGSDYISQNPQHRLPTTALPDTAQLLQHRTAEQQQLLRDLILGPACMSVLSLSTQELSLTREGMALKEADLVKDIFAVYDVVTTYTTRQETMKNIIIVTPHHIQRRAINRALHLLSVQQNRPELRDILVDTVEKVQGKTADLVIICYGILTTEELATDCDFLFTPSRLNVTLSRARAKVVFIVGQCLHTVPAKFIRSRETQKGYNLFMQATQQAQEEGGKLDVVV